MVKKKITILAALLISCNIFAQEPNKPDPIEMASQEAERLANLLKLEDWQLFYVDSTLCHDFAAMMQELEGLQRSKVENSDLYMAVQDKWMETIQASYNKIFDESQWKQYLKQGGERQIKDREKRRAKANKKGNK